MKKGNKQDCPYRGGGLAYPCNFRLGELRLGSLGTKQELGSKFTNQLQNKKDWVSTMHMPIISHQEEAEAEGSYVWCQSRLQSLSQKTKINVPNKYCKRVPFWMLL